MSEDRPEGEPNFNFIPTFKTYFARSLGTIVPGLLVLLLVAAIIFIVSVFYFIYVEDMENAIKAASLQIIVVYLVTWLILLLISYVAYYQVREILNLRKDDHNRFRANSIAVIIGLVLTTFLFIQPFLDRLFGDKNAGDVLNFILFGVGIGGGWLVWYLKQVKQYGEFFHVLLLTSVIGLCWYARLTAPEEVQLTAVAFILGSLFRIAKDHLDEAFANQDTIQSTEKIEEKKDV